MFDRVVELYLAYTEVANAVLVVGITSIALVAWGIFPPPPPPPPPPPKPRPIGENLPGDRVIQRIRPLSPKPPPSSLRKRNPTGLSLRVPAALRTFREALSTAVEEDGSVVTYA